MNRLTLRLIVRDKHGSTCEVMEQSLPETIEEIGLALRRKPFRLAIAYALLRGEIITLEKK